MILSDHTIIGVYVIYIALLLLFFLSKRAASPAVFTPAGLGFCVLFSSNQGSGMVTK
ncbi:MAG: hypothetical protein IJ422_07230 [Oscillospiraceae bacterium]|nr:hypothetical protein [Oscillospiraceae bacterium]